ncbi:MAG TPA: hypothetical protein VHC19_17195 [Pirellulales bacterium]|nr:hypothetical protein [Pirellulales bacterium]
MSDSAVQWAMEPEVASAMRQRRWLSLAMMVLIFGSGTVIGSGLTMIAVNDKYDARMKNPSASCDHVLPVMQRELQLSDEQSAEVKTILTEHDKAVGKLWTDMRPKFREQLKQLENQVNGVLTTEQQEKWHAWLEQRRRRFWSSPSRSGRHHSKPHPDDGRDGKSHFGHGFERHQQHHPESPAQSDAAPAVKPTVEDEPAKS